MRIIYVSGRYRAKSVNETFENIIHARREARRLWLQGWAVICPHTNSIFMDGLNDGERWLEGDCEILRRCDAIFMLLGWEQSE